MEQNSDLRQCLTKIIAKRIAELPESSLTVKSVCEEARISRNTMYKYYRDLVRDIRDHRKQSPTTAQEEAINALRAENYALREQNTKLVALVDHYFSAWSESDQQLQRRTREIAMLKRRLKTTPTPIKSGTN